MKNNKIILIDVPETDPNINTKQLIEDINKNKISHKYLTELIQQRKLSVKDYLTVSCETGGGCSKIKFAHPNLHIINQREQKRNIISNILNAILNKKEPKLEFVNGPETDPSIDIEQLIEDINNKKLSSDYADELYNQGKLSIADHSHVSYQTGGKEQITYIYTPLDQLKI